MNLEINAPPQHEGGSSTTKATRSTTGSNADQLYEAARKRLCNVNHWKEFAGTGSADFLLTDEKGMSVKRDPKEGDHFRISIPGPGNEAGDGYDWVRVERISETTGKEKAFCITVRPSTDPMNENEDTAHFFKEQATSTFMVTLSNNEITVAVLGRNEVPNTDVESGGNMIRNAAVATGAITLFSKIQWKKLVNGILDF